MRNTQRDKLPLITVVTLSYQSIHLYHTIRSVLSQDYPRIQYIIADDGSEVFDANAVEAFVHANKRENLVDFCLIHHPQNIGTVADYNDALMHAKGIYIFPLSGDDVFRNDRVLSEWTAAFMRSGDPIMGACCANYDESLRHFRGKWPHRKQIKLLLSRDWEQIYRVHETQKLLPGCTLARTKESLSSIGLFDTEYRLLEDYPFIMQALRRRFAVGFWPKCAIKRRSGGVSDPESKNRVLEADMEHFYEKEVFPYCENAEALKLRLARGKAASLENAVLLRQWEQGSLADKLRLMFKKPVWSMKRIAHTVFRI